MHFDTLRQALESIDQSRPILQGWNVSDHTGGWQNLTLLADHLGLGLLAELCHPLQRLLPRCPDPDMALNNLERFVATPAGVGQVAVLLEGRARTLEKLLQWLSTSQYFSDLLITNPGDIEMLALPLSRSPSRQELRERLHAAIDSASDDSAVLREFRRFRQRQTLRIGTNDLIRDRPLEEITRDISRVADVSLEVALATAIRSISLRFGQPFTIADRPAQCAALAFGKLGGRELNYSSDIDLMFVYDDEGATRGPRTSSISNDEFFGRVISEVVRLLSSHTESGQAYRIDLRLRPEGRRGPLARSLASALSYYDTLGRTWERQALIKVRPVAGDTELGEAFVRAIEPFVYRKYLSFAEINEIKAVKRRIESKTGRAGETDIDVKTGYGGIRDIEFTIQFLQLLNGGELPAVRKRNTLAALQALESVGCVTDQEFHILEDAYRYLRKTEHRLQLLFDLQTHRLPEDPAELRKLALRMGYFERPEIGEIKAEKKAGQRPEILADAAEPPPPIRDPLQAFLYDFRSKTDLDRKILNHLLHQTFQGESGDAAPESDLILDPEPDEATIRRVLERYQFRDPLTAYQNLSHLAQESGRFLSGRRCRHFLANIAPQLLSALADAPDPDMALNNLENVTASLGGKAGLWELFSFHPPSLKLFVDVCAWSQFLSEILINNPGMIDELMDSLVLNQPCTIVELRTELAELCRGAADPEPILQSFQQKELLRIGVADILGKQDVRATTAALSDLAEVVLGQVARLQEQTLETRFGVPVLGDAERTRPHSRYVLLGLGKLGGREMSYQSDLDLILVYEGDGRTESTLASHPIEVTDNFHYYSELAQRIIRMMSVRGPMGRLYEVDMRLRPTGKSGSLVVPLAEFARYYAAGDAQLWERQALTRARVVHGDADFGFRVTRAVGQAAYGQPWRAEFADEIRAMRERMEATGSERDLKRGFGGMVDIEFLVQLLKLKNAVGQPSLRQANTWSALEAVRDAKLLGSEEYTALAESYEFLRLVESRLRIVNNRSTDELPEEPTELEKLARRLGFNADNDISAGEQLREKLDEMTTHTRRVFLKIVEREGSPPGK